MADKQLKILDFAVILRNIVDLGKLKGKNFLKQEELPQLFAEIIPQESECFRVSNYVFQRVCSLAKSDIVQIELPAIEVFNVPKIFFMDDAGVVNAFTSGQRHQVSISLSLHRAGVMVANFHVRFSPESGMTAEEAIELARFNLLTLAIKIPSQLDHKVEIECKEERLRLIRNEQLAIFVGSLKDFTTQLLRPLLRKYLQTRFSVQPLRDYRCVSSTLVQLYQTDPPCETIDDFVEVSNYGKEIRGLVTLDRSYRERSESMVRDSFAADLSVDEEIGVFPFGLSDIILFDTTFTQVVDKMQQERKFKDRYATILYTSTHYSCLLEWVQLEKYLIDLYSRLLSKAIAAEDATPEKMLEIQKLSMHDLIAYKAGITPFPSREEFLEKARLANRLPELQEKLEKKRDLATDYVIQEYTLRTNRSIHLVNIFISATAAFGLMEVILSIFQNGQNKTLWGAITSGLFVLMLLLLWGVNRLLMAKKN